jgi:hypothetical protein
MDEDLFKDVERRVKFNKTPYCKENLNQDKESPLNITKEAHG